MREEDFGKEMTLITDPNPFAEVPSNTYEKINDRGHLILCKREHGVEIQLQDLGSVKKRFENVILGTSIAKFSEIEKALEDPTRLTVAELAAYTLAKAVKDGSLHAVSELFDRVIGRPKQVTENTNTNLTITIDELLLRAEEDDPLRRPPVELPNLAHNEPQNDG